MKNSILDVKVSLFANVQNTTPIGEISLYAFLCGEKCRKHCLPFVERYRTADKNKDELKRQIPIVTVSGTFSTRNNTGLKEHSGLICIDIDGKDNGHISNFSELSQEIRSVPYVAYFGRSVSGNGYFAIIPISDPQRHKEHFKALEIDFFDCGIVIDNCPDVTRPRIYSYDPDAYINFDAKVYDRKITTPRTATKSVAKIGKIDRATAIKVRRIIIEIAEKQIDITDDYCHWVAIASAFYNTFGEAGRELFHIVSRFNAEKYNKDRVDKQFDDIIGKPYPFSIGTFFKYAKDAGISIK